MDLAPATGAEVSPRRRPFLEPIYAVVRFDGSASTGVAEVVMAFESAAGPTGSPPSRDSATTR